MHWYCRCAMSSWSSLAAKWSKAGFSRMPNTVVDQMESGWSKDRRREGPPMPTTLKSAVQMYLRLTNRSNGTRNEYATTLRKWREWGHGVPIERLDRTSIQDFLTWINDRAVADGGANPGRTTNKAREQLRAVLSWAWERDMIDTLPRFPRPVPQRDVAGRHYLTKAEINALYFATYNMKRPRGWNSVFTVGHYWRAALVVFFNYGVDSGTIWRTAPFHEPILWRHVHWLRESPDRNIKQLSRWGWLFYRRVKTGKTFCRPMNHVVHAHFRSLVHDSVDPETPVFEGGGSRPNKCFRELCNLASIKPKTDLEAGERKPWVLKDLRKTCATYYDEHMPESSIEILGHTVGGVTYRHYAHRAPLAFKAITTVPQPTAFQSLVRGFDGQCPCCRRPFASSS